MEEIKINDNLVIRIEETYDKEINHTKTIITLVANGENIVMLRKGVSGNESGASVVCDDNYIIAYTRGTRLAPAKERIACAYDIKEGRFVYLNKEIAEKLTAMYLTPKSMGLKTVLAIINDFQVPENKRDEIKANLEYLRGGDESISRKEVVDYILDRYPELKNYTHYKNPISIYEYDDITSEIGDNFYFFYAIRRKIDDGAPEKETFTSQKTIGVYPPTKNGLKEF